MHDFCPILLLTFRRICSALDHVLLAPCRYLGLAQTQPRKEWATGALPKPLQLCDSISDVAQIWEYLVACLGQCLAFEVVLRRILVDRPGPGLGHVFVSFEVAARG